MTNYFHEIFYHFSQISVMNEHFERQAERNKKRSDEDYDEGNVFSKKKYVFQYFS